MIYDWVLNIVMFSIAPLSYVCLNLYKENKKQKHIIEVQEKIIENLRNGNV